MGYSSGSSGSGSSGGGEGFLAEFDSIFSAKKERKTRIVINDIKQDQTRNVVEIAEIDELPGASEHFRVTEEKASHKFV